MIVIDDAGVKLGRQVRQRLRVRLLARASGGFGLDPAAAAIRKAAMTSPRTNACLLTEPPRLENQNVSRETRPVRGDVLICSKGQVATADEMRTLLGDRCGPEIAV